MGLDVNWELLKQDLEFSEGHMRHRTALRRMANLLQELVEMLSKAGPPTTAERGSSESSAQASSHGLVSGPCPSCGVSLVISPMPKGMRISMGDDLHSSVGSRFSTAQPILG